MARISLEETAVAASIGAIDIIAEEVDARAGRSTPFQNATDLTRTGITVGAAIANYMGIDRDGRYTSIAFYADLPLWEKTLYRTAVQAVGRSTTVRQAPSARSVTVRAGQSAGIQTLVPPQQIGNYRSITA